MSLPAMRLPCLLRCGIYPSQNVLACRDRLKVKWISAASYTTSMLEFFVGWDRSTMKPIGESVSHFRSVGIHFESAVSVRIQSPDPNPTPGFWHPDDKSFKAFIWCAPFTGCYGFAHLLSLMTRMLSPVSSFTSPSNCLGTLS